jgi:hypothetical protein
MVLPSISVVDGTQPSDTLTHGPAMVEAVLNALQANTQGATSGVKILPVDIYGNSESTTTFDVAQGIYQAAKAGATVINMSLGGSDGDSTYLSDMVQAAIKQNIVLIASAGNEPVAASTYPAAYPGVTAVTASGQNGQLAPYANYGPFVSLIAPGTEVMPFDGQSWVVTGTSTSAAYISGTVAGIADSSHQAPSQVMPAIRSKFAFTPPQPGK